MHKIMDYTIYGEEMQYVEINLSSSESVVAEAGGFMMMEDGIQMKTIFRDGTDAGGIMDKIFSARYTSKSMILGYILQVPPFEDQLN